MPDAPQTIAAFETEILNTLLDTLRSLGAEIDATQIQLAAVPNPKLGDASLPCFPFRGKLEALAPKERQNPAAIAKHLAEKLPLGDLIVEARAAGPYLNLRYSNQALAVATLTEALKEGDSFGAGEAGEHVVIEFSAPNTNKPQHLGHVRNNVLGESISRILRKAGHRVTKVNLVNDRGIHICKSMLAYQRWGGETTPEQAGKKGDHLIGDFYILFDKRFREELETWKTSDDAKARLEEWLGTPAGRKATGAWEAWQRPAQPEPTEGKKKKKKKKRRKPPTPEAAFFNAFKDTYFNEVSPLGQAARAMLLAWEDGDEETLALWSKLNAWVLEGFDRTYDRLGVDFEKVYFESQTYKLGKAHIEAGLTEGVFSTREDGAVTFALEKIGAEGEKVVLRSDGTSVYITQDIGTALARFEEHDFDRMIYVVGDEQIYHFKVLFGVLSALAGALEGRMEHLSYGMVNLPHGRMKSREGTVVDADDLLDEMHSLALGVIDERRGKDHYQDTPQEELEHRAEKIGLGAIKYFLLDVSPQSTMEFNPEKSIDLQGRTGAYVMMNYARTRSLIRRAGGLPEFEPALLERLGTPQEHALLLEMTRWSAVVRWAAESRDPSRITEYLFNLCKQFAFIFTDRAGHPIATCEEVPLRNARLLLVEGLAQILRSGLDLLGIEALEEM